MSSESPSSPQNPQKSWQARIGEATDALTASFVESISYDRRIYKQDIAGSIAHATMLAKVGLITDAERDAIIEGLKSIERDIESGNFQFDEAMEDIHMVVEAELIKRVGEPGRKLHTGRSRNDQVATDLLLWIAKAASTLNKQLDDVIRSFIELADRSQDVVMPSYTHLQRAQPITVGHHLLAWVEMLERDLARFAFAAAQAEPSPLGSGALAGSTLPLPPAAGAPQLRNSLDAVADRDFALDYLYAVAVCFGHLSRIGEELCLWTTAEFGFARPAETAATGSSMMPQKLNPDVAELARGKAGTAIGRLTGLLAVVKGLPLAYDRDLQEDKTPVFEARRDLAGALAALAVLVDGLELDRGRLAAAAADPLLLATDAAEVLVRTGVPFRDAHASVAAQVRSGSFEAPPATARVAPGPADVSAAVAAARKRFA